MGIFCIWVFVFKLFGNVGWRLFHGVMDIRRYHL